MTHHDDDRPEQSPAGIRCPRCGCMHCPVQHTRKCMGAITRYRRCRHCGRSFATHERAPGEPSKE